MAELIGARIRPATPADLEAMEWGGEYRHFRRVYRQALREAQRGKRAVLLAEVGSEVVGQLLIHFQSAWLKRFPGERAGYLHSFRVKPAFRGKGIGGDLIRQAEAMLRERGYQRAIISVAQQNDRARRLYERHGYIVFGEDPGRWTYEDDQGNIRSIHEPAYLLQKRLGPPEAGSSLAWNLDLIDR